MFSSWGSNIATWRSACCFCRKPLPLGLLGLCFHLASSQ